MLLWWDQIWMKPGTSLFALGSCSLPFPGQLLGLQKALVFFALFFFLLTAKKKALSIPILVKHHVICCIAAASSLGPPEQQISCMQQTPLLAQRDLGAAEGKSQEGKVDEDSPSSLGALQGHHTQGWCHRGCLGAQLWARQVPCPGNGRQRPVIAKDRIRKILCNPYI